MIIGGTVAAFGSTDAARWQRHKETTDTARNATSHTTGGTMGAAFSSILINETMMKSTARANSGRRIQRARISGGAVRVEV